MDDPPGKPSTTEAVLDAEWSAALEHAGFASADVKLYVFPAGADLGGGRGAVYESPDSYLLPPPEQRFMEVLNEGQGTHRVGVRADLAERKPFVAAALMRHELEHARQWEHYGLGIFRIQDLIGLAAWETTDQSPVGGNVLKNVVPPEFDANAAAAQHAWSRYGEDVGHYLDGEDDGHQVLLRYDRGPGPLDTLLWRTLAYAATLAEECESIARKHTPGTFRDYLAQHSGHASAIWDVVAPQATAKRQT